MSITRAVAHLQRPRQCLVPRFQLSKLERERLHFSTRMFALSCEISLSDRNRGSGGLSQCLLHTLTSVVLVFICSHITHGSAGVSVEA
ncbi:uncharacterized [Tachysurus ichikawai]